jgi:hypothetical protein
MSAITEDVSYPAARQENGGGEQHNKGVRESHTMPYKHTTQPTYAANNTQRGLSKPSRDQHSEVHPFDPRPVHVEVCGDPSDNGAGSSPKTAVSFLLIYTLHNHHNLQRR